MGKLSNIVDGLKPTIMMVAVQIVLTGVNIFYKLAQNKGLSLKVLIAYRFIFAAATIIPLALIIERKNRPKLTWKIALQAFASALFGGSMCQNLYSTSLVLTSATFVAAMSNLIPAMTFILALLFRMERLGLTRLSGQAKVVGTLMCIGGAMILTFFKGVEIKLWSTHLNLLHKSQHPRGQVAKSNTVLGLLLSLAFVLSSSVGLIIQAKMADAYPCHYSSTALTSVFGSIQAVVYALCTEKDWREWKLGWNFQLLAAAYTGVLASGLMWVFITTCVEMRGPLFVSVFNPLLLVLVAIAGALLLEEKLYLGSVIGAVIIICGLYSVLWGKSKEMKRITSLAPSRSPSGVIEVGETSRGSTIHGANVLGVAPNFILEPEMLEVDDVEEDDLEVIDVSTPRPMP